MVFPDGSMPEFDTTHFGRISYESTSTFDFPRGLPGFEEARAFLALSFADRAPLIFLQSLEQPGLCFITLPVQVADPEYRLEVAPEDLTMIGLASRTQPRIGKDVLCLAVLSLREEGPTANMLAPIVVNLRNRRGVQAIAPSGGYSHQHPLLPAEPVEAEPAPC
jgi:flagellar assembly factor FliW